jgi:hypothetical protein
MEITIALFGFITSILILYYNKTYVKYLVGKIHYNIIIKFLQMKKQKLIELKTIISFKNLVHKNNLYFDDITLNIENKIIDIKEFIVVNDINLDKKIDISNYSNYNLTKIYKLLIMKRNFIDEYEISNNKKPHVDYLPTEIDFKTIILYYYPNKESMDMDFIFKIIVDFILSELYHINSIEENGQKKASILPLFKDCVSFFFDNVFSDSHISHFLKNYNNFNDLKSDFTKNKKVFYNNDRPDLEYKLNKCNGWFIVNNNKFLLYK